MNQVSRNTIQTALMSVILEGVDILAGFLLFKKQDQLFFVCISSVNKWVNVGYFARHLLLEVFNNTL